VATITLNRPASLNALTPEDYEALSAALRAIDKRDDVLVTIWQASGRFFCAGTDIGHSTTAKATSIGTHRDAFVTGVFRANTDTSRAFYTHSKILVAALNGPVVGIAAAFLGHFDFIYSLPSAWLSVPFTFIGLISEAGSSVSFANRMGLARANEVLLFGKRLSAEDLLQAGFVNQIFPQQSTEEFQVSVRKHVLQQIDGLDPASFLAVKKLIREGIHEKNNPDGVNMRESYEQAARIASGVPSAQFGRIHRKEVKPRL